MKSGSRTLLSLAVCWLAVPCWTQTKVDLRTQSRSVDFSTASSTKPMKVGDNLPGGCEAGEMFLLLSAEPGANLYACTAVNTWTLQGSIGLSGSHGESFANSTQVALVHNLETEDVLAACYDSGAPPRQIEWNRLEIASANEVTVYFQQPQSGRCVVLSGAGTQGGVLNAAGTGLVADGGTISVDAAVVPAFMTAAASLDFGPINGASCQSLTLAVPGVAQGDGIAPGWPALLEDGLTGVMYADSANSVTVRLCNVTPGSIDPANHTFRATVIRSF